MRRTTESLAALSTGAADVRTNNTPSSRTPATESRSARGVTRTVNDKPDAAVLGTGVETHGDRVRFRCFTVAMLPSAPSCAVRGRTDPGG